MSFFRCFCSLSSLPRATVAQQVVFIPAAVNPQDSQLSWIPIILKRFLFRHATLAWLDTFLQAAANFLPDP
jgi:hypothetical protein